MIQSAARVLACLLLVLCAWGARDYGPTNVLRFGAGNGQDDTKAIQNALNYVCALPQGRELYFPPGTYFTRSTIEIPCGYITLSSGGSAWNYEGSGAAVVIRRPAVLVRLVNLKIRGNASRGSIGLHILGVKLAGATGPVGVTKLIVDACEFTGFGNTEAGAAIDIESDSPGVSIVDSVFDNLGTAIDINGSTDTLTIRDNYIVSTAGWGVKIINGAEAGSVHIEHNNFTTAGGAVRLERAGLATIRGNEYETYHFIKGIHSAPFDLVSAGRVLFEDNSINPHGGADYGVWVGDAITDSVFQKNALANVARAGFRVGTGARNSYMLNAGGESSMGADAIRTLAYSPMVRFDGQLGNTQKVVLLGDVKVSELVNATPGQRMVFMVCQDNDGGWQFHWPSGFSGAMSINLQPGKCSVQEFLIDDSQRAYALGAGNKD